MLGNRSRAGPSYLLSLLFLLLLWEKTDSSGTQLLEDLTELDELDTMAQSRQAMHSNEKKETNTKLRSHYCHRKVPYYDVKYETVREAHVIRHKVPCKDTQTNGNENQVESECYTERRVYLPSKRKVKKLRFRLARKCCKGWTGRECTKRFVEEEELPSVEAKRQLDQAPFRQQLEHDNVIEDQSENLLQKRTSDSWTCPTSRTPAKDQSVCLFSCSNDSECRPGMKCCLGVSGCNECTSQPISSTDTCRNTCQNGGLCKRGNCACPKGYTGDSCENALKKTCASGCHNGKCRDGVCVCFIGYTGLACDQAICSQKCEPGGVCTAPNTCTCKTGYKGISCNKPICTKPCQNGGICSAPDQCTCSHGYIGKYCETAICKPKCLNGGKCKDGKCLCPLLWGGNSCEKAQCPRPCLNKGVCIAPNVCRCSDGWTGFQCEKAVCKTPCVNNGVCVSPDTCKCPSGWTGTHCESAICSKGCGNGGKCISPEVCVCAPGYTGKHCEFSLLTTSSPFSHVPTTTSRTVSSGDVCSVSGHGYYHTFDGKQFYFPGTCSYQLASDCQDGSFAIHSVQDKRCSAKSSMPCKRSLNLYLAGLNIKIHLDQSYIVSVEGKPITLPTVIKGLIIEKIGAYIFAHGWSGISVRWDGHSSIYIKMASEFKNKTCGLCGNYNGYKEDDFRTKSNIITDSIVRFGNSWKMTGIGETCRNVYDIDMLSHFSSLKMADKQNVITTCDALLRLPFLECYAYVDPSWYVERCKRDVARCVRLHNMTQCQCNSFSEYSRACARKDVAISWRSKRLCDANCSQGFIHTECGTSCPKTCTNLNRQALCNKECVDGCFCAPGFVLDNGKCVKANQCTCTHDGKIYKAGQKISKDCNNCYCTNGRWKCTDFPCPATCSVYGDPHYITYDGAKFDFMGVCNYILTKDCLTNLFTVYVETMGCGSDTQTSCSKGITIFLNNTSIKLGLNHRVSIQGRLITLPYIGPGVNIRMVSSLMLKLETSVGLSMTYDGDSRVYVTALPSLKNRTCGLCGNFNGNQKDDFMTPEKTIETNPAAFGNTWKVDPSCKDAQVTRHPCEIQIQRAAAAEKKCNKLKMAPFSACHHAVDPDEYIENCRFDVCGCKSGIKCLCKAIAAYSKACASKGVVIEWRNSDVFPECHVTCPIGEKYQECGSSCIKSCRDLANANKCKEECAAGCSCPNGTASNDYGSCIPLDECSCYEDGRAYPPGYVVYRANCLKCKCAGGKFSCSNSTNCKASKCPAGQVWTPNGAECASTCETLHLPCLNTQKAAACLCPKGLTWDDSIKKCIKPADCPCHHHGRSYKTGESFKWDCNTCTCNGTKWECTKNQCPGTCSICGDPHYTSFDGKMFRFAGACEYIVAQDYCNGQKGTFRIQAENIPCGTTGVTCTKSVKITIKDTEIHFVRGKQWTAAPAVGSKAMTAYHEVVQSGFFHILITDIGLTVMWDGGTRVYITLQPHLKGRTCGMCGNFNDDQNDDFTTPEQDVVALARMFGDSWKVQPSCPDTRDIPHPCSIHKGRAAWAHKQCNAINREVFKPCHREVNPKPYFDACYYDACGCDLGGDCECLCTAIAAYARECNKRGVHIKWRSQQLCPIQCACEKGYKACGPAYPRTCKTLCTASKNFPIKCVEGCHCNNGTVEHNGKCILPKQCPCYVDGIPHPPGSLVIKNCQRCTCADGCLQCSGPTCPPTTGPTTSPTSSFTTLPPSTNASTVPSTTPAASTKKTTEKPSTGNAGSTSTAKVQTTGKAVPTTSPAASTQPTTEKPSTGNAGSTSTAKVQTTGKAVPTTSPAASTQPTTEKPSTGNAGSTSTAKVQTTGKAVPTTSPAASTQPTTEKPSTGNAGSTSTAKVQTTGKVVPTTSPAASTQPTTEKPSTGNAGSTSTAKVQTTGKAVPTTSPAASTQPTTEKPSTGNAGSTSTAKVQTTGKVVPATSPAASTQPTTEKPSTGNAGSTSTAKVQTTGKAVPTTSPAASTQPTTEKPSTGNAGSTSTAKVQTTGKAVPTTSPAASTQPTTEKPSTGNAGSTSTAKVQTTGKAVPTTSPAASTQPTTEKPSTGNAGSTSTAKVQTTGKAVPTTSPAASTQPTTEKPSTGNAGSTSTAKVQTTGKVVPATSPAASTQPTTEKPSTGNAGSTSTAKVQTTGKAVPTTSPAASTQPTTEKPSTGNAGSTSTAKVQTTGKAVPTTSPAASTQPTTEKPSTGNAGSTSTAKVQTTGKVVPTTSPAPSTQQTTEKPSTGNVGSTSTAKVQTTVKTVPTTSPAASTQQTTEKPSTGNAGSTSTAKTLSTERPATTNATGHSPASEVTTLTVTKSTLISRAKSLPENVTRNVFSTTPVSTLSSKSTSKPFTLPSTTTSVPRTFPNCLLPNFLCKDAKLCIKRSQVCDHKPDCSDGSDENNCPTSCPPCSQMNFQCLSTCQCIPMKWVCDKNKDCPDGSDEGRCSTKSPPTTEGHVTTPYTNRTRATTSETRKQSSTSTTASTFTSTIKSTQRTLISSKAMTTGFVSTAAGTSKASTTTGTPVVTSKSPTTITATTVVLPPCSGNKIFKPCVQSCQLSCQYLNQSCTKDVQQTCQPGCQCPSNLVNNGTHCVLPGNCPCIDAEGRFRNPSESWEKGCQVCSCFNNSVLCFKKQCPTISFCPSHGYHVIIPKGECCSKCVPRVVTVKPTTKPCRGVYCSDGKCISKEWLCDGERDCKDGGDERNCTHMPRCFDALGMEDRRIRDEQITVNSKASPNGAPKYARLNQLPIGGVAYGAWCSDKRYPNSRLSIDLKNITKVTKIATQGRPSVPHYVTKFRLQYSVNGLTWTPYSVDGNIKILDGNKDSDTIKVNKLKRPFEARYIQVEVVSYFKSPCLRLELYGCAVEAITTAPIVTTALPTTCPEFSCDNGTKCISNRWVCDGSADCRDATDEKHCGSCRPDQFRCKNGQCINKNFVCDKDYDCRDKSDELNCNTTTTCKPTEYQCPNGKCIRRQFLCDGDKDCPSGTDEAGCPTAITTSAPCTGFICYSNKKCIPKSWKCDKYKDCPLGEDEQCCANNTFICEKSGKCIPLNYRCDNYIDCPHGEDEKNCKATTPMVTKPISEGTSAVTITNATTRRVPTTESTKPMTNRTSTTPFCTGFLCPEGTCIPQSMVCDGRKQCHNGIDELNCGTPTVTTNASTSPAETTAAVTTAAQATTKQKSSTANYTTPATTTNVVSKVYTKESVTPGNQTHGQTTAQSGTTTTARTVTTEGQSTGIKTNGTRPSTTIPSTKATTTSFCQGFLCPEGICIPLSMVCDGKKECPSGIDEANCTTAGPTTAATTKSNNETETTQAITTSAPQSTTKQKSSTKKFTTPGTTTNVVSKVYTKESVTPGNQTHGQTTAQSGTTTTARTVTTEGQSTGIKTNGTRPSTTIPSTKATTTSFCHGFLCPEGICIPKSMVCDGKKECPSGVDESNCTTIGPTTRATTKQTTQAETTSAPKSTTKTTTARTVTTEGQSTGIKTNGTRPSTIIPSTKATTTSFCHGFLCPEGICIPMSMVCDGKKECPSGVDESNCTTIGPTTRATTKQTTQAETTSAPKSTAKTTTARTVTTEGQSTGIKTNGTRPSTIRPSTKATTTSFCHGFLCPEGICIPMSMVCDGKKECPSGVDESNCTTIGPTTRATTKQTTQAETTSAPKSTTKTTTARTVTTEGQSTGIKTNGTRPSTIIPSTKATTTSFCHGFLCPEGICIPMSMVCDGKKECPSGVDESNCTTMGPTTAATTKKATQTKTTSAPQSTIKQKSSTKKITTPATTTNVVSKVYTKESVTPGNQTHGQTTAQSGATTTARTVTTEGQSTGIKTNGTRPSTTIPSTKATTTSFCHGFLCPEGICIPMSMVCDGKKECPSGVDEANCTKSTTKPTTTALNQTTTGITNTTGTTPLSPTSCKAHEHKICYRSCNSMAQNKTACEQVVVADLCGCPNGFAKDQGNTCYQSLQCPCVRNGTVYKTGASVKTGQCTKCVCFQNGFKCEQICEIQNCPEGEELVQEEGKCCHCKPKEVCKEKNMVETACACLRTCEHKVNQSCTLDTCKRGCACPENKYYNGTNCVSKRQCYCMFNGTKKQPNSEWRSGECDLCKCLNGKVKCGKICDISKCPQGMNLVVQENGCCVCQGTATSPSSTAATATTTEPVTTRGTVPSNKTTTNAQSKQTTLPATTKSSNTVPTTSGTVIKNHTTTFKSSALPSTTKPSVGSSTPGPSTERKSTTTEATTTTSSQSSCKHISRLISYRRGDCVSQQPLQQSICSGSCPSSASVQMDQLFIQSDCNCCSPQKIEFAFAPLLCKNGTTINYRYVRFESCSCKPCSFSSG